MVGGALWRWASIFGLFTFFPLLWFGGAAFFAVLHCIALDFGVLVRDRCGIRSKPFSLPLFPWKTYNFFYLFSLRGRPLGQQSPGGPMVAAFLRPFFLLFDFEWPLIFFSPGFLTFFFFDFFVGADLHSTFLYLGTAMCFFFFGLLVPYYKWGRRTPPFFQSGVC